MIRSEVEAVVAYLKSLNARDGRPQPIDTVANRRGISLLSAPHGACRSWIGQRLEAVRDSGNLTPWGYRYNIHMKCL